VTTFTHRMQAERSIDARIPPTGRHDAGGPSLVQLPLRSSQDILPQGNTAYHPSGQPSLISWCHPRLGARAAAGEGSWPIHITVGGGPASRGIARPVPRGHVEDEPSASALWGVEGCLVDSWLSFPWLSFSWGCMRAAGVFVPVL
jgi:hypothetical protein